MARLDKIQDNFANGDFKTATSDKDIKSQSNLDLLLNGIALFHQDEFAQSDSVFEEFNKRNLHETSSSLSREAAGLLLGQSVNSYKPYMMDSLFVSYYQIWDLLAMHEWSNARVVINQSYARQQNMSKEYKKLIEENKNKISEKTEYQQVVDKNISDWAAFSDIMNPALMYLSGIYFLNDGDFDNATTYLKRANGMMPENTFIVQDLKLAQNHKRPQNITWQFIDTGFAPRLREKNGGIFLPYLGMVYFSFTEPYSNSSPVPPKDSELLANVDAMFMTEYREYQTNEILRSFASAASKTALQASLYNSHSSSAPLLGILSSVYTVSSSNSDVRTWATLPKYIYISRTNNETGNKLIYTRIINDNIQDNKTITLK